MGDKKKRSKRRKRSRHSESSGSESESDFSESSADSFSESSSSEDERRRRKRRKRKEKEKRKSRKEKKRKKDKKSKKKKSKSSSSHSSNYGKYGVIQRSDNYVKQSEFYAWLIEFKKVSRDSISNMEEEKYRQEFIEDYNTATLPDKKYYDLEKWRIKQQKKNKGKEQSNMSFSKTDEERLRVERQREREAQKQANERLRLNAMVSQLKQARDDGGETYEAIMARNKIEGPATFESIAEKRRAEKREQEGYGPFY